MEHIYLDHAATTPMDKRVIHTMVPIYEEVYGNPSSVHAFGRKARQLLDEARRVLAKSIDANEKEIIFTSGGTEADNLALIGTALANKHKGNHIITTTIEHHATLHTAEYLEKEGFEVTYLPVNKEGKISVEDVKSALRDETILVSVMYVNNETGVIQPIKEIGELLKGHKVYFHTDAVQAYGTIELNVNELAVDLLSVSAHKINGPKGIGFLYAREGTKLNALQFGGEQERKRRPGTENVVGAVGFQSAVEIMLEEREIRNNTYEGYKNRFIEVLKEEEIDFNYNGDPSSTVPSIINISFPGTNVEKLLANFDLSGVAASSGSACTAGSVEPSHVLSAIYGANNPCTTNSIRFSFGAANTMENVTDAAHRVAKIIKRLVK
ncbi:cysteine desulfurase family protein [Ornithinibacillus halotolerans]|uniref:cysteine desulfurase n=1 Tax=Ornithinibacillus halotolerans TaxID=1274357 RepID=A0A916RV86_9BACI|nr:cysteine desulfurase family protein [Ornithinibacillus halotolerans]GGA69151.1 cysteine desulfurase [Ornithinibacillus halotolerans]